MPLAFPLRCRVEHRLHPGLYGTVVAYSAVLGPKCEWRWVRWDDRARDAYEPFCDLIDVHGLPGDPFRMSNAPRHV